MRENDGGGCKRLNGLMVSIPTVFYVLNLNVYSSNLIYENFFSCHTNFGMLLWKWWLGFFQFK